MTDERLAELERLANAATPGPWFPRWGGEPGYVYSQSAERVIAMLADEQNDGLPRPNSQLIAAARTAVPELIAEVRRLRAAIESEAARRAYAAGLGASEWESFLWPEARDAHH